MDKQQTKQAYRWLLQQAKPARLWIMARIGCGYVAAVLLIVQAALLAHCLDAIIINKVALARLIPTVVVLLLAMSARALVTGLQEPLGFKAGAKIRTVVRQQFLVTLMRAGPVPLLNQSGGQISSLFIEQIEALQGFYADYQPQLMLAALIPLTILIIIFKENWLAGLILLFTAPLIPLFMALIGSGVESLNQQHFKSLGALSADFLDTLRGLLTLKLLNQSKAHTHKIAQSAEDYRKKTMAILRVAFLSSATLELFSAVSIAIVAVILGLTLLHQIGVGFTAPLTLSKAFFILLLIPEFFLPLRQLGVYYHARAEAIAAAQALLTFFSWSTISLPAERYEGHDTQESQVLAVSSPIKIEFNAISFAYPGKKILFENFSLSIKTGAKIAIVGPSGAGKTTLLHLLMGFLPVVSGAITINQQNLQSLSLIDWRKNISYLGQMPQLFSGTIRDNIVLANPKASETELYQALEKSGSTAFVAQLPAGLDTFIAEQNYGLSGGQAQRLALARVFIANRPIVILDEPTASLDEATEQQIVTAIKKYLADKTVIMVSHRPMILTIATQIIEL